MTRPRLVAVLTTAVAVMSLAGGSVARAETAVDRAVAAWTTGGPGVYLDPAARGQPLETGDADRVERAIEGAATPVFVAALGEPSVDLARAHLRELVDTFHRHGTYVVVGRDGFLAASDVDGVEGNTQTLAQEAIAAHRNQPPQQLAEFVRLVDAAAASAGAGAVPRDRRGVPPAAGEDDPGGTSWLPLVLLVVVGVGVVALIRRGGRHRSAADVAAFTDVRRAADEDVTLLGEELTALDVPPASTPEATADYEAALGSYEQAKSALARARRPDDVRAVTTALEDGRWRLACVRARLAGRPLPERRPPCFFNPQHGPSAADVAWTPAGGQPREVPVCAADADRLARGDEPDARLVSSGGRQMPYWQGPAYFGPYAGGFFGGWGGGAFLGGLLVGELLSSPAAFADTGGYGGSGDAGYDAGAADGSGDFAGDFDSGGGDWGGDGGWGGGGDFGGGGDWGGGGDFGGGDF